MPPGTSRVYRTETRRVVIRLPGGRSKTLYVKVLRKPVSIAKRFKLALKTT